MVQAAGMEEAVASDLPEALKLLSDMTQSVDQVTKLVDNMLVRVKSGEISTDSGLSFLEVKYHMLLSYLINLTFLALRKVSGQNIEGDPVIDRLVEIRTVLERIRPIDHKLKYQIDKLVKASVTGTPDSKDPSNFKANPANFATKFGDSDVGSGAEESDGEAKEKEEEKSNVYVPLKLAAVHYDGDDTAQTRQQKQLERAKRRALQSSVMQELRQEYMDTPLELRESTSSVRIGVDRQRREQDEYEETYFTRLPVTKRDKQKSRRLTTLGTLGDDLTRFEDISVLEAGADFDADGKGTKRKSMKGKKKGSKGYKKRKLH